MLYIFKAYEIINKYIKIEFLIKNELIFIVKL